MFQLHDLRESKVWQEAEQVGEERGLEKGIERTNCEHVKRLQANGKPLKDIAELLGISLSEVRRYSRSK